jgi:hypothetical protein
LTRAKIQVSSKPHIKYPLQMSESLLYYTDVKVSPPYNPFEIKYFSQMEERLHDLYTHQEMIVDFGGENYTRSNVSLYGNQLITDTNPPRAIVYGKSLSLETIISTIPAADAVDVDVLTDIQIQWSGAMNPDTMTAETIALSRFDEDDNFIERVALDIAYDTDTHLLTLSPASLVSHGTYRIYLDGRIEDSQGSAIIKPVISFFYTEDVTGPVFIRSSPAKDSVTMLPTAPVRLYFNEPLDKETLAAGILFLTDNTIVQSTISLAGGMVSIWPDKALLADTLYGVEINAALTDETGNPVSQARTISFTTCKVEAYTGTATLAFQAGSGIFIKQGTQAPAQVVSNLFNLAGIFFSPDGGTLFYGDSTLFSYTLATHATAPVDTGLGFVPALDFDGDKIIYARQKPGFFIYQVVSNTFAGDAPEILFEHPDQQITALDLSPDGKHLAIIINQGYTEPPLLAIINLSTKDMYSISGYVNMAWSQDSTRLFAVGTGDSSWLTSFDLELKDPQPIRDMTSSGASDLFVSHSGNSIAIRGNDYIDIINIHTGLIENSIVYTPGMMGRHHVVWSPDDTCIFFGNVTTAYVPQVVQFDLVTHTAAVMAQDDPPMGMPNPLFDLFPTAAPFISPPVAPIQEATLDQKGVIHISWKDFTQPAGLIHYNIYRSDMGFKYISGMTPIATVTAPEFFDTGVPEAGKAYYAVTAILTGHAEPKAVNALGPVISGDGDSLDNPWELLFFKDLSALPSGDFDKDGLTNAEEFKEFTDPTQSDTDGDLVFDGAEVAAGFNPLISDILPLSHTLQDDEVNVGDIISLAASGGSGAYTWTSSDPDIVSINDPKTAMPIQSGVATLTLKDRNFLNLPEKTITLTITSNAIKLNRMGSIILQKNGYLDLAATGGSGLYDWVISDETIAKIQDYGVNKRLVSLGTDGTLEITVSDHFYKDLPRVHLEITAGIVPGDVNGNSLVEFDDAMLLMERLSDTPNIPTLNLNADMDGNAILDMKDVILIFQKL